MKRSAPRKKPGFFAHLGIFLGFYILSAILGAFIYGNNHPGTEILPKSYSAALLKWSVVLALVATILKAFFPTIKHRFISVVTSIIPEPVQNILLAIWDFCLFLIKAIVVFIISICILSIFGLTDTETETSIVIIGSFIGSLSICFKPYCKIRLQRKLDQTNREIARLEREISEMEALKRQVMFDSVSFIDSMEGYEFEYWCAELLEKIGFENVEVTKASNDDGVDIIAQKDGIHYAIQCKRYSSDLGNTPIQEVHAGKDVYNCHIGAVMTNRYFTSGGKRVAEKTGTLLWDRDWIISQLEKIKQ